ncbi:MAG: nucleoside deaminase [Gammaproteobacteria bacterium]|nr:nucleoside deaminase [Gammaproteobacteria bacterium]
MSSSADKNFLDRAIQLACQSIDNNGGPFGAVIVRDNKIIGEGHNQVTLINDPTAHAEIMAIRNACETIQNFDLSNCTIYSSCEPCPMCMSAIYWARINRVIYAASGEEAASAGFDDTMIAHEICIPYDQRSISIECENSLKHERCFELWAQKTDKTEY